MRFLNVNSQQININNIQEKRPKTSNNIWCSLTETTQQKQLQKTETSNKGKPKLKQYSKTTPNTPILPKTTAKHLQTPKQRTSVKLLLTITPFSALLAQAQTSANKENDSEISEEELIDSENKEDKMTTYIVKISEFNREDIETSSQEWLNQVTKAGDANG
ncbi:hypothetical protein G9A89_004927 [Geosiphon pyriformis]|nr:hypothetical protein G9A89_004927 [Geosiphon pyriformis]